MWDFFGSILEAVLTLWPWSHEPGGRELKPWLAWTLGLLVLGVIVASIVIATRST